MVAFSDEVEESAPSADVLVAAQSSFNDASKALTVIRAQKVAVYCGAVRYVSSYK